MHYAVKRAYAPLAVQAIQDTQEDSVDVFIVSDMKEKLDAGVTLQLVSLNDTAASCATGAAAAQRVLSFDTEVPGMFATRVWSASTSELLAMRPDCSAATCFLVARVSARDAAGEPLESESQLWLTPFKNIDLPDPALRIASVALAGPDAATVTLTSQRPAALVLLSEAAPLSGHYDDNAFSVNPCEPRTVKFTSHLGGLTRSAVSAPGAFYVESLFNHSSWGADDVVAAAVPEASVVAPAAAAADDAAVVGIASASAPWTMSRSGAPWTQPQPQRRAGSAA